MDDDSSSRVASDRDVSDGAEKEPHLSAATSVGTQIDIVSDTICPWCYIGKRHLEHALTTLAEEGLTFQVHWNPFQLNPDMPTEGRDRASYRAWKFGSASKAAALDRRITEAAANVGLEFRTDLMTRTPNTIDSHRMIWFAGQTRKPRRCGRGDVQGLFHRRPRYRRAQSAGRVCRRCGTAAAGGDRFSSWRSCPRGSSGGGPGGA